MNFTYHTKPRTLIWCIVFLASILTVESMWAGHEGHGSSPIGQALQRAQRETLPILFKTVPADHPELKRAPKLQKLFQQKYKTFSDDLRKLQLQQTHEPLTDVKGGYATWIALSLDRKFIYYNSKAFESSDAKKSGAKIQAIATEQVLHELGHYYGLNEDDAWDFSRTLIFAYQKTSLETKPELLAEVTGPQHRSGMTYGEVLSYCETQKKIFEKVYFYVYCNLTDKYWDDVIHYTTYSLESRLIGYRQTGSTHDEWSAVWLKFPRSRETREYQSSSHYYDISPVTELVWVPKTATATERRDLYDIKVYGVGRIEFLTVKTLMDSAVFYENSVPVTYDSAALARLTCRQNLQDLQMRPEDGWRYDRAQCETYPIDDGPKVNPNLETEFAYRIKTLNPYILD